MIGKSITKNSIMLGIFAIAVAASLAATELFTRELREESIRKVQYQALEEIIPADRHDNPLLDDSIMTDAIKLSPGNPDFLQLKEPKKIYIARIEGKVVAFIFPTRAPDGYGGAIESIVGVNLDGSLAGVRVIQHQETPGLGDKVEVKKSDWVLNFQGKSLQSPSPLQWGVKKDKGVFDQFTGATVTPRAVVKSVYNTLLFYQEYQVQLMELAYPEQPEAEQNDESGTTGIDQSESSDAIETSDQEQLSSPENEVPDV